jgi:hypothetical protein
MFRIAVFQAFLNIFYEANLQIGVCKYLNQNEREF